MTLDRGKVYTRKDYIDLVIKNATNDGILKSQKKFKTKGLRGREIDDIPAYDVYRKDILNKAEQFRDARNFDSYLSTFRKLRGDEPDSKDSVLTSRQIEFLIEYPDLSKSLNVLGTLYGGITKGGATIEQAQAKANEMIRQLEIELRKSPLLTVDK